MNYSYPGEWQKEKRIVCSDYLEYLVYSFENLTSRWYNEPMKTEVIFTRLIPCNCWYNKGFIDDNKNAPNNMTEIIEAL